MTPTVLEKLSASAVRSNVDAEIREIFHAHGCEITELDIPGKIAILFDRNGKFEMASSMLRPEDARGIEEVVQNESGVFHPNWIKVILNDFLFFGKKFRNRKTGEIFLVGCFTDKSEEIRLTSAIMESDQMLVAV